MRYCVEKNFRKRKGTRDTGEDVSIIRKNNKASTINESIVFLASPNVYESLYY